MTEIPVKHVLGTPLHCTSYEAFAAHAMELAAGQRVFSVEFANTQVLTMRRHEPPFRAMTEAVDYFIPDAMPLVWCLNMQGAVMRDRVYGPAFMRHFLNHTPGTFTHYLLGGSEDCGRRLRDVFAQANPSVRFAGGFHGPCSPDGRMAPADEARVLAELDRLQPDFIWVGFGTPKQQAWVWRHKSRLRRGVIFAVGYAFDVNAGTKRDQPMWMQQLGLGWLFRLCSEPRRLAGRYLKYNSLFLLYLLWDGLRGKAWKPAGRRIDATSTN